MIELHRLNQKSFYLNHKLIERVEENPDTTIHLMNGQSIIVKETAKEIQKKIIEFERQIYSDTIIKIIETKDQK